MSKHLSECFASLCECDDTHFKSIDCDFSCICPSLRACEQRVLDAAREAVVALKPWLEVETYKGGYDCCGCSTTYDLMEHAVAAIDALREKP